MTKIRVCLTLAFLFAALIAVAQIDSSGLKITALQLDNALLGKDEEVLKQVLHKNVSFGHSNGWIQSKSDVLNDFKSGKLVYNKIENNNAAVISISKKQATVRTNTNAEGTVNGNAFKLTLHVMQVWIKTKKGWQLYARQSAKQ